MSNQPWRAQFERQSGWAEVELKFSIPFRDQEPEWVHDVREMLGRLVAFPNGQRFVLTKFGVGKDVMIQKFLVELELRRVPTRLFVAFQEFNGDPVAMFDLIESGDPLTSSPAESTS